MKCNQQDFMRGSVAARRARGSVWSNGPTQRQTARHGAPGRERVASSAWSATFVVPALRSYRFAGFEKARPEFMGPDFQSGAAGCHGARFA